MSTHIVYNTIPTLLLCQMYSLLQDEPEVLERLGAFPGGSRFVVSSDELRELVARQDRDRLDEVVPEEICRPLLASSQKRYSLQPSGLYGSEDGELTLLQVYDTYGGGIAELTAHKGYASLDQVAAARDRRTSFLEDLSNGPGRTL